MYPFLLGFTKFDFTIITPIFSKVNHIYADSPKMTIIFPNKQIIMVVFHNERTGIPTLDFLDF